MKKISRAVAIAQGQRNYFTGEMCKYGHTVERDTLTGACKECHRRIAREYIARVRKRITDIRKAVGEQKA